MGTSTNSAAEASATPPGYSDHHIVQHKHNHPHFHHHAPPTHRHSRTLSSTSVLVIAISTISAVAIVAVVVLLVMLRRLKSAKNIICCQDISSMNHHHCCRIVAHGTISFTSSPDVKGGCLYGTNTGHKPLRKGKGVQVFTFKELEIATDRFSEANVIGNADYGVIYRGILADGTMAAIKMFGREGKQVERAFRTEVDLLRRLHSPYLVELLGYCADQRRKLLIYEFMPNGTLQNHLQNQQYQPLDWVTRLRIALDCARALEFLHEHTTPSVILRDFNSRNVLLDQNFRAKVSDFGFAKISSDKTHSLTSTPAVGTTGYLAPEYVSTGKLTTKSDVYSYGVVLLQLLTGRTPVDTRRPPGEHVLVSWALPRLTDREKIVEMVDPALRGNYSKKDLIQVAAIAAMCVQPEGDYRPLMTDVVQSLIPLVRNLSSVSSSGFQNQMGSHRS